MPPTDSATAGHAETRLRRRLVALSIVVGAATAVAIPLAGASRSNATLLPDHVRVGDTVPAALARVTANAAAGSEELHVVFLRKDCRACRALVSALARSRSEPADGRAALLIADSMWSDLFRLRSDRIAILTDGGATARALGVRATPTLATLHTRSGRIAAVTIGIANAYARFSNTGRLH